MLYSVEDEILRTRGIEMLDDDNRMEDDRSGEDLTMCEDEDDDNGDGTEGDEDEDDEDEDNDDDDEGTEEIDDDEEAGEDGEDSGISKNEGESLLRRVEEMIMNDEEAFQDTLREHKRSDKAEKDPRRKRGRQARRLLAELLCVSGSDT